VQNAVPDSLNYRHIVDNARFLVRKRFDNKLNRVRVRRTVFFKSNFVLALCVVGNKRPANGNFFDNAHRQDIPGFPVEHLIFRG